MGQLLTEELATLVEESLEDVLHTSYYNAQSVIRSFVFNAVEQVMLDIFRKDVIGETLKAHKAEVIRHLCRLR